MKAQQGQNELIHHIAKLIVPTEILDAYEIVSIIERTEELEIELVEKESLIPDALKGKEAVSNGYMNPLTLQHFPMSGKRCYLKLVRRRWKEKADTKGTTSCNNTYDFAAEGTKATKNFGSFLKEYL